jgi:hypothetical protein
MILTVVENDGTPVRVLMGGSDGILVTIGAGGIVVVPPEGPGDPELLIAFKSIYDGVSSALQAIIQLGRCRELEILMSQAAQEGDIPSFEQYEAQYNRDGCGSVSSIREP